MLDRTIAPPFHDLIIPKLQAPEIRRFSNGCEMALFLNPEQHLISLELIFPASNVQTSQRILDLYAFKMLLEGTSKRSSKKLADDISFLGASVDISHSADYENISISCLSKHLPKVLNILDEMWAESIFPAKEWKTIQETGVQQNAINLQKTAYQAGRLLRRQLFGDQLDYGYSFEPERVGAIQSETLQNHFSGLQKTGPALALVSGWADAETLHQLSDWLIHFEKVGSFTKSDAIQLPDVQGGLVWNEQMDSQQSSLRIGQYAIDSRHPDSPMFNLTLEIFGGYFGSRLMSNIREDKGWTYGIFAQRVPFVAQPYWVIGSDIKGEIVHDAIAEIRKESVILRTQLVEAEELDKVKNYMLGQFLTSITNCYGMADRYKSVWMNGIDFDRVERNLKTILHATPEQILETAQKYLDLDSAVVAISGSKV